MDEPTLELFYAQLDKHRQRWEISWRNLAAQAKVSKTLWGQMKRRVELSAEDLTNCGCGWITGAIGGVDRGCG